MNIRLILDISPELKDTILEVIDALQAHDEKVYCAPVVEDDTQEAPQIDVLDAKEPGEIVVPPTIEKALNENESKPKRRSKKAAPVDEQPVEALAPTDPPAEAPAPASYPQVKTPVPEQAAENVPESAENVPESAVKAPESAENVPESAENVPESAVKAPESAENVPESDANSDAGKGATGEILAKLTRQAVEELDEAGVPRSDSNRRIREYCATHEIKFPTFPALLQQVGYAVAVAICKGDSK